MEAVEVRGESSGERGTTAFRPRCVESWLAGRSLGNAFEYAQRVVTSALKRTLQRCRQNPWCPRSSTTALCDQHHISIRTVPFFLLSDPPHFSAPPFTYPASSIRPLERSSTALSHGLLKDSAAASQHSGSLSFSKGVTDGRRHPLGFPRRLGASLQRLARLAAGGQQASAARSRCRCCRSSADCTGTWASRCWCRMRRRRRLVQEHGSSSSRCSWTTSLSTTSSTSDTGCATWGRSSCAAWTASAWPSWTGTSTPGDTRSRRRPGCMRQRRRASHHRAEAGRAAHPGRHQRRRSAG